MHYDFIAIPDADVPQAVEPVFQHVVTTYASEANKTVERVAGGAGRPARLQAAREDEHDPHHPGPPASLRAPLLRSVRRHRGAARRRTPASRREARRAGVHRQVRLAGEATAAAVGAGHRRLVAGAAGPSSAACSGSGSGCSGGGCCTPATTGPRCRPWLRLAGHEPVPAIYGPSGDVKWDEADPTYSLEAAKRGG